jgi:hypothetical protein
MGLIGDVALKQDMKVEITPSSRPVQENVHNPDGYNPELVSYLNVNTVGERFKVPVLPIHKLERFAKINGITSFEFRNSRFQHGIYHLAFQDFPGRSGQYTFASILRADSLERLIDDIHADPDKFIFYGSKYFKEDELAFLETCLTNLKLEQKE